MAVSGKPAKVLIIDDDPVSALLLESVADSASLEAITGSTVREGIRLLNLHKPQIALIDVQLPDGDGTEILCEMRSRGLDTIAAFITGSLREFPFHKCGTFQPDMLFGKPIDNQAIAAWLEKQTSAAIV